MRPWSADQSPYSGDPRYTGMSGMPASEQHSAFSGHPTAGSMSWGGNLPSGTWTEESTPFNNQTPSNWMPPPSSMYASPSPRQMEGEANVPPPQLEMAWPAIPLGRFGNATGFNLKLRFLLALTLLALAPAFVLVLLYQGDSASATTGLLQGRNVPLIFLSIMVVTTLVATWVALPIVRPIRRATREILASTDDVRLLAEQAKQIAKDQRMGTVILEGAAKGLDMRRQAMGRDAGLIVNSATVAATKLSQISSAINEMPESLRGRVYVLTREVYQELQTTHQLASGIASRLERDPVQTRLGNVMEGAAEISEQFDQASQQLQMGATRLEHAAESLQ
jgi:hypothetical protein